MRGVVKRRSRKAGLPPGSLVHIGERKSTATTLHLIYYDGQHFESGAVTALDQAAASIGRPGVTWLHITGVHEAQMLQRLDRFGLHPLVLEDIVNTDQRTKYEDYGDYVYIVLKLLRADAETGVDMEQISIVLGRNFVISVEEGPSNAFDSVRAMVEKNRGQLRHTGADYLAYLLLDRVVDNYFAILENLGERTEALQDELVSRPSPDGLAALHRMRREALLLRRSIWPLREMLGGLGRLGSGLFSEGTALYLRDVYDHAVHVVESIDTYREMLGAMLEVYLSSVSYKMNQVIKVLTIITTIFMPLTFIAGIYGMNFDHMPELKWRWGYPAVLGAMLLVVLFMLRQFRKKGWL